MTEPDALPAPRPRVWPVFVTFAAAVPVAGLLAAIALLAAVGLAPFLSGDEDRIFSLPGLLAASAATELALIGAVLVAARPLTRARLRLQRGRTSAGVLVAATLGVVALSQVLETVVALLGVGQTGTLRILGRALEAAHGGSLASALLVVALLAGFAEELFFRGFMQTRLAQRWSARTALLVSALCFGAMHLDPVHSPLALGLGVWLGFVCERAGSLWPAVLAHVVNNAVATVFAGVGVPLPFAALAVLAFVACAVWLTRALPPIPAVPAVSTPGAGDPPPVAGNPPPVAGDPPPVAGGP